MGKVVAEIMKGHVGDELPFFVASLTFELRPEMLNSPFGKVVRTPVLPQPGSALAGEDIHTLRITIIIVWFCWREVVVEGSPGHIMQIECAGLAAFGIDQGNAACPLIDDALIQSQSSDLTDAQPCPIAQGKDGGKTGRGMLLHHRFEDKAL